MVSQIITREMSVMPCIGKLFESIPYNRLSFKNEVCNDIDPYQAGFKSNSRTTDNIFILCSIIDKQRCLFKPLYTCFVNFTNAFDYIQIIEQGNRRQFAKRNKKHVL